jgi:hypothetical protein
MIRRLPRTPRGTWLLAGAVWLAGIAALWWALPYRPRASWPTEEPAHVHGFIPGTSVVLTSSTWIDMGTLGGPLLARDAASGEVREWLPDGERLTLVNLGVDGRSVVIGRVVAGRARLFLHDVAGGDIVAELPRDGRENLNEPRGRYEQAAAIRPDGRWIAYADPDGHRRRLRVWDVETKQEVATLPDAGPPLAWSPDGRLLACCPRRRDELGIGFWDASAGHIRKLGDWLPREHRPNSMAFSPDGRTLVAPVFFWGIDRKSSYTLTDCLLGWDVVSGNEIYRVAVTTAAFPPGVTWFATDDHADTLAESTVHRRDYATGADLGGVVLKPVSEQWLDPSPNGKLVFGLAVQRDPIMEWINQHVLGRPGGRFTNLFPGLCDTQSGRQRYSLPMGIEEIVFGSSSYGWSSDGTLLAIAGKNTLAVWDIPPRKSLSWFAVGATLFALPPFVIARRRVRELRQEAAA